MTQFKDKTILVTGASRGIGKGIAETLATKGAKVLLTYSSNKEAAQTVCDGLSGDGHQIYPLNLSDVESVESLAKVITEEHGPLYGVVNNAGITKDQLILRMKVQDFDDVIQTNLKGSFWLTKLLLKPMLKARVGSVVTITSVIGQTGNAGQTNYAASKAGLEAMSKSLALEVGSRNIRFNCVAPGFIETDMTNELSDDQRQAILNRIPLQKLGQVSDVANAVSFLLSDQASYITGHTLSVNGGMYMS